MAEVAAVFTALKDLLKFRIIQYINTGDKTYDNVIQTFCLALLTMVFGFFSADKIKSLYIKFSFMSYKSKINTQQIDPYRFKFYQERASYQSNTLLYWTWNIADTTGRLFTDKFCKYFMQQAGWLLGKNNPHYFDIETENVTTKLRGYTNVFCAIRNIMEVDKFYPLLMIDNDICGIVKSNDGISIFGSDAKIIKVMINAIKNIKLTDPSEITKVAEPSRYILKHSENSDRRIYRDRNMSMLVSRHKSRLMVALDNFKHISEHGSNYGGFGTYNLGIIVHGLPGTGKTHLMKSICNYLDRDAYIIDMRKIKTQKQFEDIFLNERSVKTYVFIFDEFDCVKDVIKDRSITITGERSKPKIEILRERQLELLKIMSMVRTDKDDAVPTVKDDEKNPLKQELKKINDQITDEENGLTLDTILTVLDGVVEVRGRVIIAATNYIDHIDSALLRNGRFDLKLKLDNFNDAECHEMIEKMFPDASAEDLMLLKKTKIVEDVYTPTQLINLAVTHGNIPRLLDIIKTP
jgi:hypothetical protein